MMPGYWGANGYDIEGETVSKAICVPKLRC